MKVIRFKIEHEIFYGIQEEDKITKIVPEKNLKDIYNLKNEKNYFNENINIEYLKILPPVYSSKIVCVGLNYIDHAKELNMEVPPNPIIFLKPPTAIIGHNDFIVFKNNIGRVDYEGELAIVIGKACKNKKPNEVKDCILGYTILNDVTARDIQKKEGQWTRAKSYDTFSPIGPLIETEIKNPDNLKIKTFLNGKIVQNSSTSNFIFKTFELVSFISNIMTLLPGDIISTGTPPGIGPLSNNDIVEIEVENIGILRNRVKII